MVYIIFAFTIILFVFVTGIIYQYALNQTAKYKKRWLEALHTIELLQEGNTDKKLPSSCPHSQRPQGPWTLKIYTSKGHEINHPERSGDVTWFDAINTKTKDTVRLYGDWSERMTPEDVLAIKDRCMKTIDKFNRDA